MSAGIRDQLSIEEAMVERGVLRFKDRQSKAEKAERGADTDYARRLIAQHLLPLSEGIAAYLEDKGPGRQRKVFGLLKGTDADTAAFFLLKGVFNSFTKEAPIQAVAVNIGRMIEDELRFSKFKAEHAEYFETLIEDFKRKGSKNYRYMHRVLTKKANDKKVQWNEWSNDERAMVGARLIQIMMDTTELVERVEIPRLRASKSQNNKVSVLRPTEAAQDWVRRFSKYASMLDPDLMPCIIAPDPWIDIDQGGYYSPRLRSSTGLILNLRKRHRELLEAADLTRSLRVVNALQATPWAVNTKVLSVMQDVWEKNLRIGMPASEPYSIPKCPVPEDLKKADMNEAQMAAFTDWKREAALTHSAEGERVSKCFQVARSLRMATEYSKYERFWFVYQRDFRGRIYAATSGLSPQGADTAKALIHLAEGLPLGDDGLYWLAVHAANCYGFDKVSYDDRAAWIEERRAVIVRLVSDPLSYRELWANADKPWCFLAACFELAGAWGSGDSASFASHVPVSLDGSCNGLQHFSAMLRDPVGGAATNLCASHKPADIYATVGRVCGERVRRASGTLDREWSAFCAKHGDGSIPRALAKKPVMTLPYGSTKRACTDSIFSYIREKDKKFFSTGDFTAALHLTPVLWDSISDTVVAAREAMSYIQKIATRLAKADKPIQWTTPMGFPVYQATHEIETKQITTAIGDGLKLRIGTFSDKLDVNKQRQGASPNFVHSMDATHQDMTVLAAEDAGIRHFAMVHDSFGTHAARIPEFARIIRETFVELYSGRDHLATLAQENTHEGVRLPEPPKMGTLDIRGVLEAQYFFG